MKKVVIALSVVLVALLCVCGALQLRNDNPSVENTKPTETVTQTKPAETVTVEFVVAGEVISQQNLTAGQMPEMVNVEIAGLRFVSWLDDVGADVDPFAQALDADAVYTAVCYPVLLDHVAFLFADANNTIRPDDVLTEKELCDALNALASDEAVAYFPELPNGEGDVTSDGLVAVLEGFFEADSVAAAFSHVTEGTVTRSAFAAGMVQLLGYNPDETVTLAENALIPVDVTGDRSDAIALLQAAVAATVDTNSEVTWADVELPVAYAPGFVNIDGWLYYVQEDHYFLKDGDLGTLHFDENGRYTCGDGALDEIVAKLLKDFIDANPDMERLEILREVYDYCHEEFGYRRTYDHPAFGENGWEIQRASAMFEKGKGNCYSFAAIFWALSRGLGYETRAISGTCLKDEQPHSWCIIEIDGADYFFDPEWEYAYHERGIYDKDMFMIPMERVSYWTYKWVEE